MRTKYVFSAGVVAVLAASACLLRRSARVSAHSPAMPQQRALQLLRRATPLLRLPTSPDRPPEVLADSSGLRCTMTGRVYPYRDGVLDLIGGEITLTATQHALNTSATAWAYDQFRNALMRSLGLPDFVMEVANVQKALRVGLGDIVLDLACGHGNFTVEWAKHVGPNGLVIGLDISPAMLARAAEHVGRLRLGNVLLIHGDAHHLSLADGCVAKVNCSGGFHQFPDLPQALREIARVSAPGATLAASTFAEGPGDRRAGVKRWLKRRFALHFVPLDQLAVQLAALGYCDYAWLLPGGWFGYVSAKKRSARLGS